MDKNLNSDTVQSELIILFAWSEIHCGMYQSWLKSLEKDILVLSHGRKHITELIFASHYNVDNPPPPPDNQLVTA